MGSSFGNAGNNYNNDGILNQPQTHKLAGRRKAADAGILVFSMACSSRYYYLLEQRKQQTLDWN